MVRRTTPQPTVNVVLRAVATARPQPTMRRSFRLLVGVIAGSILACVAGVTCADPLAIGRRIVHPDGVAIQLQQIDFGDASIVLSATISNPGDREIRLNRARSFVLDDGAHGVHHLSPPADNPELRIPPRTQLSGDLVFIGPLASAARRLTLSSNRGIGTTDNPYDDAPVFEAALPMADRAAGSGGVAVSHPDGAALVVRRIVGTPTACLVSLLATNGNDRTIVLNQDGSLVLTDDRGTAAALKPPADNRELVVPSGDRLDADLLFDCRNLDTAGALTLISNRGTAGTPDNPYDTLPVFTLNWRSHAARRRCRQPRARLLRRSRARFCPRWLRRWRPVRPLPTCLSPPLPSPSPPAVPSPSPPRPALARSPAAIPAPAGGCRCGQPRRGGASIGKRTRAAERRAARSGPACGEDRSRVAPRPAGGFAVPIERGRARRRSRGAADGARRAGGRDEAARGRRHRAHRLHRRRRRQPCSLETAGARGCRLAGGARGERSAAFHRGRLWPHPAGGAQSQRRRFG